MDSTKSSAIISGAVGGGVVLLILIILLCIVIWCVKHSIKKKRNNASFRHMSQVGLNPKHVTAFTNISTYGEDSKAETTTKFNGDDSEVEARSCK